MQPPIPLQGFVAYSHEHTNKRKKLDAALNELIAKGWIAVWHNGELLPGESWSQRIPKELKQADIVLLLVSRSFFNSPSCLGELEFAINILRPQGAVVVPIILEPCSWTEKQWGLYHLEVLPDKGKPVSEFHPRSKAYKLIETGIQRLIEGKQTELLQRRIRHELDLLRKKLGIRPTDFIALNVLGKNDEPLDFDSESQNRYLIEAEGGAGKTEWLYNFVRTHHASERPTPPIPWYLHLARVADKLRTSDPSLPSARVIAELVAEDVVPLLPQVSPPPPTINAQRQNTLLVDLLERLVEAGQMRLCLDGLDQVELTAALALFLNADPCNGALAATRPTPNDPTLHRFLQGYSTAQLERVSMAKARLHLKEPTWQSDPVKELRQSAASRNLLRLPLFLQMLKATQGPGTRNHPKSISTKYNLLDNYWTWATHQEDVARTQPPAADFWQDITRWMTEMSWRLAVNGQIEHFTRDALSDATPEGPEPHNPDPITRFLTRMDQIPGRWDLVRASGKEYQFKHQAFQEYFVARALAEDSQDFVVSEVLAALPEQMRYYPSFWIVVMELLPGAVESRLPQHLSGPTIWTLAQRLIAVGQPLLAWILVREVPENATYANHDEQGRHWRYVIFQLIRYRLDIDKYFPKNSECWHYDTIPSAINALDRFSAERHHALRDCLRKRLGILKPLDPETLGIYEMIFAWTHWDGSRDNLDKHRIAFLLTEPNSAAQITAAVARYLNGSHASAAETSRYIGVRCKPDVTPDPARFGEWLKGHLSTDPSTSPAEKIIAQSVRAFEDEDFDPDFLPKTDPFFHWMTGCFVEDFYRDREITIDVSLSLFFDKIPTILRGIIKAHLDAILPPFLDALARDPASPRFTAAMILLKGVLDALKENGSDKTKEIKTALAKAFEAAANPFNPDHFSGYPLYHEYSRMADTLEETSKIREFVLRFLSQEIRYLTPYIITTDRNGDFVRDRMKMASYKTKRWLYFLNLPFVDPQNDAEVDSLLLELDGRNLKALGDCALNEWEWKCQTDAVHIVSNLREIWNGVSDQVRTG